MKRRALLTTLPAATLSVTAGCIDWGGSSTYTISLKPVDAAVEADRIGERVVSTDAELRPTPMVADMVSRLLDGEVVEFEAIDQQLLADSHHTLDYYEADGTFYSIDRETLAEGTVSGPVYDVSRIGVLPEGVSEDDEDRILPFADLPAFERWRIHEALVFSDADEGLIFFADSVVVGYLDPEHRTDSLLRDGVDQDILDVGGDYVELEGGAEGVGHAEHVRFSADRIATDAESFVDYVIEKYAIDASDLSDEERALVETLHETDEPLSASSDEDEDRYEYLRTMAAQFRTRSESQLIGHHDLYIRYEGTHYRLDWWSSHGP